MSSGTDPENLLHIVGGRRARPAPGEDGESARERLLKRVMWQSRRLSTATTLYSIATADHLGMNLSDMLCLGILAGAGPISPSQLATLIGLSTGSVTGLIDRLERLNLVRRERDEQDRRRIVLHLNTGHDQEIGKPFVPMLEAAWQHLEQFSDDDLRVIARYQDGAISFMREATQEMRVRERAPIGPIPDDPAEG